MGRIGLLGSRPSKRSKETNEEKIKKACKIYGPDNAIMNMRDFLWRN